eukprot:9788408-Alexandrium_andersonii.AAC.1
MGMRQSGYRYAHPAACLELRVVCCALGVASRALRVARCVLLDAVACCMRSVLGVYLCACVSACMRAHGRLHVRAHARVR